MKCSVVRVVKLPSQRIGPVQLVCSEYCRGKKYGNNEILGPVYRIAVTELFPHFFLFVLPLFDDLVFFVVGYPVVIHTNLTQPFLIFLN